MGTLNEKNVHGGIWYGYFLEPDTMVAHTGLC